MRASPSGEIEPVAQAGDAVDRASGPTRRIDLDLREFGFDRAQLRAQARRIDGVELLARHGRLTQSRARRGEFAGHRLCGLKDEAMRLLQGARFGLGAAQ